MLFVWGEPCATETQIHSGLYQLDNNLEDASSKRTHNKLSALFLGIPMQFDIPGVVHKAMRALGRTDGNGSLNSALQEIYTAESV